MKVNVNGLINRLDDLRERMYNLFNKLEKLDDLEQEEIEVEYIEKCFQDDDEFNLSLSTVILEQAIKLDNTLDILKTVLGLNAVNRSIIRGAYEAGWITKEQVELLKEILGNDEITNL